MPYDIDEPGQLFFHQLEGDALVGLNPAEHQSDVLIWKEALRNYHNEVAAQAQRRQQAQHHEGWPLQCAAQAAVVQVQDPDESTLAGPVEPPMRLLAPIRE